MPIPNRLSSSRPVLTKNVSYKTQYTVLKTDQRVEAPPNLSLQPEGQVYWYHDTYVNPAALITDIPCDSLK